MANSEEKKAILKRAAESMGIAGKGWNQKLAEKLGIGPDVLSHWKTRNAIDLDLLSQKLTPDQFLYATKGRGSATPIFSSTDYVSRTEFLSELAKANRRIDHVKTVLAAVLRQVPGLDLTGIEEADP